MSFFDVIVCLIYFIGFPVYLRTNYPKVFLLLFIYHTIFVFTYWYALRNCGADACVYWFKTRFSVNSPQGWFSYFGLSTNFMLFLDYPLVKYLKLDFLSGFLLYGLIGFIGILNLYKILSHYDYGKAKAQGILICIIILFLPNMHYWTCAIGKDTLAFFSISCIFLHIVKNKPLNLQFAVICAFFFLIRPHIDIFLLSAIGAATILNNKKIALSKRVFLGALGLIIIPVLVSVTLSFVHLDLDNMEEISQNFETTGIKLATKASSAIPMGDYILPVKIFTFLFRPFIFDIHDVATLILAIENTFLFIIFVWAIQIRFKWKIKLPYQVQAILFFSLITTIFYCYRETNLGIIIRMKNMLLPFLITYPLYMISCSKLLNSMKYKKITS